MGNAGLLFGAQLNTPLARAVTLRGVLASIVQQMLPRPVGGAVGIVKRHPAHMETLTLAG
jgi:hypothetical protein